jgi:hypothetical protein
MQNGDLSIWTAIIDKNNIGIDTRQKSNLNLVQNYPNPAKDITYFAFKLHKPTIITLKIFDLTGKEIATLIENEKKGPGKYVEKFSIANHSIKPGVYSLVMNTGDQILSRKMLVIK